MPVCIVAFRMLWSKLMEQLCTQDTDANIVHMGMGGEEVVVM